jgi:cytochrome P450
MKTASGGAALLNGALDYPWHAVASWILRWFAPIFRLPMKNVYVVTRYDDVRDVLSRSAEFPVPWADKMKAFTDDQNFVLGMADDAKYRLSYEQLARVFRRRDVPEYVSPQSAKVSAQKLSGRKSLDVIQDLMWAVPTQLTEDYYGIPIRDKAEFAYWTVAVSGHLFGPPFADPDNNARAAAGCLRGAINEGIRVARAEVAAGRTREHHVLQRLVKECGDDAVIRAQLFGMVLGFIPTNLIASGNILDTLLRRPEFMEAARAAALDGDNERLWRCLQEALRFRFINPGAWRKCCAEGATIAAGTSREARIPAGAYLLVSMQSAMFDARKINLPTKFDPNRPPEDYLVFGHGQHWCIGAYIAMAQITQTFKVLLKHTGLRRAAGPSGQLRRINIYPAYMNVELEP